MIRRLSNTLFLAFSSNKPKYIPNITKNYTRPLTVTVLKYHFSDLPKHQVLQVFHSINLDARPFSNHVLRQNY